MLFSPVNLTIAYKYAPILYLVHVDPTRIVLGLTGLFISLQITLIC